MNSDEESKEFYEKLGFKIYEKESELINPYRMFLPKENREILTDKYNSLEIL